MAKENIFEIEPTEREPYQYLRLLSPHDGAHQTRMEGESVVYEITQTGPRSYEFGKRSDMALPVDLVSLTESSERYLVGDVSSDGPISVTALDNSGKVHTYSQKEGSSLLDFTDDAFGATRLEHLTFHDGRSFIQFRSVNNDTNTDRRAA